MGTLGFGIIVYIVFNEATELTGGPSGFTGIPKLSVAGKVFASDREYYYVVWGAAILLFLRRRTSSCRAMGRALRAIHTSRDRRLGGGGRHAAVQIFVFVLSAFYAAIAGRSTRTT
jgi:branched-chain amino acid transport system permease protein